MSLKDLSDGKTGQVVEAIVVKEVKPGVIINSDGKTSGAVLVAEDPDRKYTGGGQGLKVIKPEVLQMDPLVLSRNPLFSRLCLEKIFYQNDNISWLQIS